MHTSHHVRHASLQPSARPPTRAASWRARPTLESCEIRDVMQALSPNKARSCTISAPTRAHTTLEIHRRIWRQATPCIATTHIVHAVACTHNNAPALTHQTPRQPTRRASSPCCSRAVRRRDSWRSCSLAHDSRAWSRALAGENECNNINAYRDRTYTHINSP
jgi:hypothetical protein